MFTHGELRLRKLDEGDLDKLLELKQESWFGTHRVTILNSDDQKRWFASLDADPHCPKNLVLIASTNLHVDVGVFKANIDWANRHADVGWDIFKDYRGNGLGRKLVGAGTAFCFEILSLHRLSCEILESNIASIKCAEHSGYVREGRKREAVLRGGKFVNSLVYGVLEVDFTSHVEPDITPPGFSGGLEKWKKEIVSSA